MTKALISLSVSQKTCHRPKLRIWIRQLHSQRERREASFERNIPRNKQVLPTVFDNFSEMLLNRYFSAWACHITEASPRKQHSEFACAVKVVKTDCQADTFLTFTIFSSDVFGHVTYLSKYKLHVLQYSSYIPVRISR